MIEPYRNARLSLYSPANQLNSLCSIPKSPVDSIENIYFTRKHPSFINPSVLFAERRIIDMKIKSYVDYWINLPAHIVNCLKLYRLTNGHLNGVRTNGGMFVRGKGRLELGENVVINSSVKSNPSGGLPQTTLYVRENAHLKISSNSGISNTCIYCSKKIEIGEYVLIGAGCKIYDTDFHSIKFSDRFRRPETAVIEKPVIISNGVFVGANSIILKGVTIGEQAVVGAGSVVTKDIPAYEIWAGNPARFIRKIEQE